MRQAYEDSIHWLLSASSQGERLHDTLSGHEEGLLDLLHESSEDFLHFVNLVLLFTTELRRIYGLRV